MDIALRDAIVNEFKTNNALDAWVEAYADELADNVFVRARLDERVVDLFKWADGEGKTDAVLQALADYPPSGNQELPNLINLQTQGRIRPRSARQRRIPPIEPHKDWFVTDRPFVNRDDLRTALETLDTALAGSNSVLVIDGDHLSGKSYSVRFAVQCAPQDRFVAVDIGDWQDQVMNAADLAAAIDPAGGQFTPFDETKENVYVPRILTWLDGRLRGKRLWIIVDHCSRANLTAAAELLLFRLAGRIEKGFLPGIRMILADVQRSRLPDPLPRASRYDHADLPNRTAIKKWCETLSQHIGKPCKAEALEEFADEIFAGFTAPINNDDFVNALEDRLNKVFDRIQKAT